jgi:hypothetical protein
MTMTPSIGRIVHLFPGTNAKHLWSNGNRADDPIAAVIVRVWDDETVNLMVLLDGESPIWVTSVRRTAANPDMHWDWPQIIQNQVPSAKALS